MAEASRGGPGKDSSEARKVSDSFTTGGVRKTKFEPKVPLRRVRKLSDVKKEPGSDGEIPGLQNLLRDSAIDVKGRRGFDQKVGIPARVAFGYGSSTTGRPAAGLSGLSKVNAGGSQSSAGRGGGGGGGGGGGSGGGGGGGGAGSAGSQPKGFNFSNENLPDIKKRPHVEPLDYSKYYPSILPLRRPNSGRIADLDEEEFGASPASLEVGGGDDVNPARDLSLWTQSDEERLLFFQIPSTLPFNPASTRPAETNAGRTGTTSTSSEPGPSPSLDKLPEGLMGKLLVYKSGSVKLKFGEVILDVAPGADCVFAQELMAVNAGGGKCCFLGDISQRVVLTPDVDKLLEGL